MITSLHGILQVMQGNSLVVNVGGVGLQVFVATPTLTAFADRVDQPVDLLTHLVVREDALTLYGFTRVEERQVFELLLGISGIGPRLALAVLSTLSPEALANAVQQDQPDIIARVPGLGKKTALRIIVDLKGKLTTADMTPGLAAVSDVDAEVISALTALGYSIVEAQAAVQSIPRDAPADIEERIVLALAFFG